MKHGPPIPLEWAPRIGNVIAAPRPVHQQSPISCSQATRSQPLHRTPTGKALSHFTIVYVPPCRFPKYRDGDRHWVNECVAVDGRILKLFEANTDEVFVVKRDPSRERTSTRTILIS